MNPVRSTLLFSLACVAAGLAAAAEPGATPGDRLDCRVEVEGPRMFVGESLWLGPTARLVLRSLDVMSGDRASQVLASSPADLIAFAARASQGSIPGAAGCRNAGSIEPLAFTLDDQAPEITWEVVDLDEFPNRRRKARTPEGLSWSGGARWMPLTAAPVRIGSDTPQLLVHGARFDIGGANVSPGRDEMLRVRFQDAGAGVDHVAFQLRSGNGGNQVLEIETVDLVGNSRKVAWGVTRSPRTPGSALRGDLAIKRSGGRDSPRRAR